MKMFALAFCLALTLAAGTAFAADAKELYAKCAGCHGADGAKTTLGNRPLKGMSAEDFAKAMEGYKAKTYGGAKKFTMEPVAAKLSTDEIKALAAYATTL